MVRKGQPYQLLLYVVNPRQVNALPCQPAVNSSLACRNGAFVHDTRSACKLLSFPLVDLRRVALEENQLVTVVANEKLKLVHLGRLKQFGLGFFFNRLDVVGTEVTDAFRLCLRLHLIV